MLLLTLCVVYNTLFLEYSYLVNASQEHGTRGFWNNHIGRYTEHGPVQHIGVCVNIVSFTAHRAYRAVQPSCTT